MCGVIEHLTKYRPYIGACACFCAGVSAGNGEAAVGGCPASGAAPPNQEDPALGERTATETKIPAD